ncbi:hypothetical protein J437_LFUL007820 [Ladona fulva]|uniref:Uncharacterized protein n=1 Tax=Ladona fulva TaxID=123851 RepID=A0A8K0K226_LADFU|nr:hypothetical protein J437_LFUL007820 [Ladona fulva]
MGENQFSFRKGKGTQDSADPSDYDMAYQNYIASAYVRAMYEKRYREMSEAAIMCLDSSQEELSELMNETREEIFAALKKEGRVSRVLTALRSIKSSDKVVPIGLSAGVGRSSAFSHLSQDTRRPIFSSNSRWSFTRLALFQRALKIPALRQVLYIFSRSRGAIFIVSLRISAGIPSGPGVFLFFREDTATSNSPIEKAGILLSSMTFCISLAVIVPTEPSAPSFWVAILYPKPHGSVDTQMVKRHYQTGKKARSIESLSMAQKEE